MARPSGRLPLGRKYNRSLGHEWITLIGDKTEAISLFPYRRLIGEVFVRYYCVICFFFFFSFLALRAWSKPTQIPRHGEVSVESRLSSSIEIYISVWIVKPRKFLGSRCLSSNYLIWQNRRPSVLGCALCLFEISPTRTQLEASCQCLKWEHPFVYFGQPSRYIPYLLTCYLPKEVLFFVY